MPPRSSLPHSSTRYPAARAPPPLIPLDPTTSQHIQELRRETRFRARRFAGQARVVGGAICDYWRRGRVRARDSGIGDVGLVGEGFGMRERGEGGAAAPDGGEGDGVGGCWGGGGLQLIDVELLGV